MARRSPFSHLVRGHQRRARDVQPYVRGRGSRSKMEGDYQPFPYEEWKTWHSKSGNPIILGTTQRGKIKITSQAQINYLHAHQIDHTHFAYDPETGRLLRKTRHTY